MSNVYELPTQEDMYEAASCWIAKLDRGLRAEEEKQMKSWLEQNPAHQEILFEMASLWDRMDSLSRLSSLFPSEKKPAANPTRMIFAAAASFLVVVLSGMWGLMTFAPETASNLLAWGGVEKVDGVYETGIGEHSTVNLPDGSQLVLNTNSLIQVLYSDKARLFYLQRGEVHIEVAHDTSRPLSVIARGKVVQAVGTAFNVQIFNDDEVELIVTDGKVLVAEHEPSSINQVTPTALPSSSLAVSKGEQIVLGSEDAEVKKIESVDIEANLSWRQGNLVFRGETLEEALAEISRYTDVEFEIVDETIKQERIAGLFKAGDIKGLLSTLEQNFRIDHQTLASGKVVLKSI